MPHETEHPVERPAPPRTLRILAVTNMYPTPDAPHVGTFIESQIRFLRASGVIVDLLLLDRLREGVGVYARIKRRLRPFLANRPDLIHVHYGGVMAERVTRLVQNLPVVITYNGSDLQGAALSPLSRRVMGAFGVLASRRAARKASGIVLVSNHLARRLPGRIDPRRVRVIPYGVDLERFRPLDAGLCRKRLGWRADQFCVLFVSNNGDPLKRPELARAAVERLREKGVPGDLKVLGGLRPEEVPFWINASDVLLLTSLHEGSPTIVKEALACNRPVVSADVGDVGERIAGLAGCHLSRANPEALADRLRRVYTERIKVVGRDRIRTLSAERTAQELIEFYEEVLDRHVGARHVVRVLSVKYFRRRPAASWRPQPHSRR